MVIQKNNQKLKFQPNYLSNSNPIFRFLFFSHLLTTFINLYNKLKNNKPKYPNLSIQDIPNISYQQSAQYLSSRFQQQIQHYFKKQNIDLTEYSLLIILLRVLKKDLLIIVTMLFCHIMFRVAASICLQSLIESMISKNINNIAYTYGSLLLISLFLSYVFEKNFYYFESRFNNKFSVCFISTISNKITRLSQNTIRNTQTGKIINMLSNDFISIENMLGCAFKGFLSPIMYISYGALIYYRMGKWGLICIVFPLLILPVQIILGKLNGHHFDDMSRLKDKRIKSINQMIQGIRLAKLYGLEQVFNRIIKKLRGQQIRKYILIYFNESILITFFTLSEYFGILITIATVMYVSSLPLSAAVILSTMDLMIYLNTQSSSAVFGINFLFELKVIFTRFVSIYKIENISLRRINPQTHQPQQLTNQQQLDSPLKNGQILFKNFNGYWSKNFQMPSLKNLNILFEKGKFYGISGKVGSGKSGLLFSILKQLPYYSGVIQIKGDVAYVQQQPYIFSGTARYNITFGKEYDEKFYNEVVKACCLDSDFNIFSKGDQTLVGERGITISGGQKARLALARAVYSRSDIYLLDDPISAVDAKVARRIYQNVITGILKGKTVLLVTHQVNYLNQCDRLLIMDSGKIIHSGTPNELIKQSKKLMMQEQINHDQIKQTSNILPRQNIQQFDSDNTLANVEKEHVIVKTSTYMSLFNFYNTKFLIFLLVIMILAQLLSVFYLRVISHYDNVKNHESILITSFSEYFIILITISFMTLICTFFKHFFFYYLVLRSNQKLHSNMISSVMRAPTLYFDKTSSGSLINRFSNDIGTMDSELVYLIFNNVYCFLAVLIIILNIFATLPIYIPIGCIHLGSIIMWCIYSYDIFKETKLLSLKEKEPVFLNIQLMIEGITQLNAYKQNSRFANKMIDLINNSTRASNNFAYMTRIFNAYITYFSFIFYASVVFLGIHYIQTPGLYGMMIVTLVKLDLNFFFCTIQFLALQGAMISVARVQNMINLKPQARQRTQYDQQIGFKQQIQAEINSQPNIKTNWPQQATVQFKHFDMRYRKQLDPVLNDLNLFIKHGEKVGIVGRTGAGKSSIIQALFRMTEGQQHSQIFIGGYNARQMGLHSLRKSISIIPQKPFLFQGTIRDNLDPMQQQSQENIWQALQQSDLKAYVESLPQKLNTDISNVNETFSVGQKQLFCLARAILRKNKILVLDEATSNVDMRTDDFIQNTLKTKFKEQTVITIAHRLNTIADYDRVIVMDKGRIVQNGNPFELLVENKSDNWITKNGLFADMVLSTGANAKVIFKLAQRKYKSD